MSDQGGVAEIAGMAAPATRVPAAMPPLDSAGLTHRGCVRRRNEDAILTDPGGTLWAVSDGMGGHGHGDVASDIVIDCLAAITDEAALADPEGSLIAQLQRANGLIRARAGRLRAPGMGATAVALVVRGGIGHVAWVGDSRAYLCRDGALRPLTRDHSVVQDLLDRGQLTLAEAAFHPQAHVVTRAVGGAEPLAVDVNRVPLLPLDWLLLCSDGLTGCVPDTRIGQLLMEAETPEDACRRLLVEALEAGGPDNISVIAARLREG